MTPSQFRQALETLEPSPMAPVWWSSQHPLNSWMMRKSFRFASIAFNRIGFWRSWRISAPPPGLALSGQSPTPCYAFRTDHSRRMEYTPKTPRPAGALGWEMSDAPQKRGHLSTLRVTTAPVAALSEGRAS